jgi:hypothetical protein
MPMTFVEAGVRRLVGSADEYEIIDTYSKARNGAGLERVGGRGRNKKLVVGLLPSFFKLLCHALTNRRHHIVRVVSR